MMLSRISIEIKLAWGFNKELNELKRQLTRICLLLEAASVQPNTNPLMSDWLIKINDVGYEAEDLLDEWSYEVLKQQMSLAKRNRDKLKGGVYHLFFRLRMGHKVRNLRKLIGSIYTDAKELGIQPIKVAAGDVYSIKPSHHIRNQQRTLHYKRQCVEHEMGLGEDHSWSLFMARLSNDNLKSTEKELIARRMIKNCGGVPLAIRALGDLLRDKSTRRWNEIEKSDLWKKKDEFDILQLHLPNTALKKCFSFCTIFGEDEVIKKDRLIYMWMAHGFLQPYDEMELTGEEYFKILLDSSLFQEAELDEIGNVKTFKIHDLVWSLARVVSMKESMSLGEHDRLSEVRHRSIINYGKELTPRVCKKLRTCVNDIPLHIQKYDIPQEITKLYHLQTLWIRSIHNIRFPKEIVNLVNLRHIRVDVGFIGIPEGLGTLTALQTLPVIDLREEWGGRLNELGLLNNLRGTLEIHNLYRIGSEEEAESLVLRNKFNLNKVVLKWNASYMMRSSQTYQK
ncbi:putative disease resistance protein RGA4 [Bienertia sinuspersici]